MISTVGDVAQQGAEISPELTDWNDLCHYLSVPHCVRTSFADPAVPFTIVR